MKQRILIVDDDPRHRNLLVNLFENHDFDTLPAADAIEMQKQRQRFHCDLLVLDINMPGEDGYAICARLRNEGDMTPILFLTGRDQANDRIHGLNLGADDYLAKPFESLELIARVRAILRRVDRESLKAYQTTLVKAQFGDFILDSATRTLLCKGCPVMLSYDEFELLKILVSSASKPVSRNQLAVKIKGVDQKIDQRYLDQLVSRLRKRLNDDFSQAQYIQTVRGFGYVFKNAILDEPSL